MTWREAATDTWVGSYIVFESGLNWSTWASVVFLMVDWAYKSSIHLSATPTHDPTVVRALVARSDHFSGKNPCVKTFSYERFQIQFAPVRVSYLKRK